MWGVSLSLIYPFVVSFDATDFWWWVAVFLIYGLSIGLPILIYPRTMSKIHLDETGISKIVFRKSKEQFIKWCVLWVHLYSPNSVFSLRTCGIIDSQFEEP